MPRQGPRRTQQAQNAPAAPALWAARKRHPAKRATYSTRRASHRVDTGGAVAWQPAGDEGDAGQHQRCPDEGQPVIAGDAEQEALEESDRAGGHEQADDDPRRNQSCPLPDDQSHDVAPLRPEGHADPDLTASLRDGVAEQGVDPERREQQSENGEEPHEDRIEARLRDRGRQSRIHRHDVVDGRARTHCRRRLAKKGDSGHRIAGRPDGRLPERLASRPISPRVPSGAAACMPRPATR